MIEKYIPHFIDLLYKDDVREHFGLDELRDAFHTDQIRSKKQAIEAFNTIAFGAITPNTVLYIGCWTGFLTYCLSKQYPDVQFSELDADPRCRIFNQYLSQLPHYTADVFTFPELKDFEGVINLSCEHMDDSWFDKLVPGTRVVLQSNNYEMPDHTNCCYSIQEMTEKYKLTKTTYQHTLKLNVMERYTLAGIK